MPCACGLLMKNIAERPDCLAFGSTTNILEKDVKNRQTLI